MTAFIDRRVRVNEDVATLLTIQIQRSRKLVTPGLIMQWV